MDEHENNDNRDLSLKDQLYDVQSDDYQIDPDDSDEEQDLEALKFPIDQLQNLPQSATLLSIDYNPDWKVNFSDLGEVAGVDADYDGTIWVFHRGDHSWDAKAYIGYSDIIAYKKPTSIACILQIDRETGNVIRKFGEDTFYMPHGITVTKHAIWVTDTGTHMIYKFSKEGDLLKTIGELKIPGHDDYQFCKPTDVAVDESTGEFYVADGYCNSRYSSLIQGCKPTDPIHCRHRHNSDLNVLIQ